jgi:hypothetical protein
MQQQLLFWSPKWAAEPNNFTLFETGYPQARSVRERVRWLESSD